MTGEFETAPSAVPYFIILPIYALLLVLLAGAAVVARCIPSWRPASGFIVAGAVGTLFGFVVANVVVTLAGFLPLWGAQHFIPPPWLQQAGAVVVAVILLVGPFVASGIGVALGFAAGVFFRFRRRRKRVVDSRVP